MVRGGIPRFGTSRRVSVRIGSFGGQRHTFRNNFGVGYFPFSYGEYEEPYSEPLLSPPAPIIIVQSPQQQSQMPAAPPAAPKIIDIPAAPASVSRIVPQSPAVFVLNDGQQLESSKYLITSSNLSMSIGRQQRTIPLSMVNIDATVAANRQRGRELLIPTERSEITIGF